jgi:predicted unusual protein kinase regulating ubiquinone biosynthesis (AarF/ABC1/UbiB family)
LVLARTVYVFFKLFPAILALRKDRVLWISNDGKNVDQKRFKKNARRILNTCISLGPVYIKFGQWLSSRADILPQPYLEELSKLQDSVPPVPFERVKSVIEQDIGKIEEKFDSLDRNALSGASLGQVYKAVKNGQQVIVKVRRPGIEKMVEEDLKVLMKIIPFAMKFVDPNLRFSIIPIMKQFVESIHEEMDYSKESENLKNIKKNMLPYENVVIPNIHDDYSTKNILTMEYIPGIKVTNIEELDKKGIDRQKLVIDVHKIFFTMLLRHSIFHADPHPGNISVKDDGTLILYDFGMIGRLNNETRLRLVRLYLALVEKDPSRTVNAMDELGMLAPDFNREVIEKGIEMSIKSMYGKKPDEMEVEALMSLANKTMSKFPFKLPKHLALYLRMSTIIEGIYHTHNVDFKFIKVLRQILEEESLIKDAYIEEIKYSFKKFVKTLDDTLTIAPEIKKFMDENRMMQYSNSKKSSTLLSGSILSAAVFLGSAFLFQSNEILGIAGMIASGVIIGISALFRKR